MTNTAFKSAIPTVRVRDSRRSQELFERLGFQEVWSLQTSPDFPRFVEMHRDGVSVFLSEHEGDGPFGTQVYFVVDDADAVFEALKEEDVEFRVEIHDAEWGHRVFALADYDGNTLRIGSPIDTEDAE